jgi:hypothetical protein
MCLEILAANASTGVLFDLVGLAGDGTFIGVFTGRDWSPIKAL